MLATGYDLETAGTITDISQDNTAKQIAHMSLRGQSDARDHYIAKLDHIALGH
jgi:hypothetical protein